VGAGNGEDFSPVSGEACGASSVDKKVGPVERRIVLAELYNALPAYGSMAFWHAIEDPEVGTALPLELLVRCVRAASSQGDIEGRNRIIEVIIRRTSSSNEQWANAVLKSVRLLMDEREALRGDLLADLYERVIRALIDPERLFWEENFLHCLRFERQHVYSACMKREGRWNASSGDTRRVPRSLIKSIDQPIQAADDETWELGIEDERAQQELLEVERDDLSHLILYLPEKLKSVVWLIFWEGRTEKDTARALRITDRTVRNRLREALKILRENLDSVQGVGQI
jgi:DNA-directed RNA polymerase specialized sigma24 family protein